MKLVFYSVVLNQHQAPVADSLYNLIGNDYCFVELTNLRDNKGSNEDFSQKPYLLKAWENSKNKDIAMELALTAECCVFGPQALEYQIARMQKGLLSFDMGERWLKKGYINLFSPNLIKWHINYYLRGWKKKPLYKLCMSAYAAEDHQKLGAFKNRCYKWGYFTYLNTSKNEDQKNITNKISTDYIQIMWCSRYLKLKHPELAIKLAYKLKMNGYKFHLDMYGSGNQEPNTINLAKQYNILDVVSFHGAITNTQVKEAMQSHDIFLFTSDSNEGWGAVTNEAMSSKCTVVASNAIGSIPYLINDGYNGLTFKNKDIHSLYEKVTFLINNPIMRVKMAQNAFHDISTIWSPHNAAKNLLQLICDLQNGKDSSIKNGPCSKA